MSVTAAVRAPGKSGLRGISDEILAAREWIRLIAVAGALVVDVALLSIAATVADVLRNGFAPSIAGRGWTFLLMILPAYILASIAYRGYSLPVLRNRFASSLRSIAALLSAAGCAFAFAFALQAGASFSRLETAFMIGVSILLLVGGRSFGSLWLGGVRKAIDDNTFLLGDETAVQHGTDADGVIDVRQTRWLPSSQDPDFLDLIARTFRHADRVVLSFSDPDERARWASFMRLSGINTELMEPRLENIIPTGVGSWAGAPTLIIARGPLSLPERVLKRGMDLAAVIFLAPVVVPLTGLLALLIKMESPGPALFVQERVGKKNARYQCYKLRTMRLESTDSCGRISAQPEDRRVTRIGRFLRKASLDELPQLWNVFIGDMSLVGPRPHALGSTADGTPFWRVVDGYWTRHAVKPGITGLAQVRGLRGGKLCREDLERRLAADIEYLNSWSIWLDLKILLKTPFVVVHKNAY